MLLIVFFMTSLLTRSSSNLARKNKIDILKYNILICPVHLTNINHWTVIVVNFNLKYIHHLDSYPKQIIKDHSYIIKLRTFLDDYITLNYNIQYNWAEWKFDIPQDIPMQALKSYDCGIFICLYVKHLCVYRDILNRLTISHDINILRNRIKK